jgi:hypothetical protein
MANEFRSDGSPTIGYIVRDDETGYDEDVWVAEHELIFGNDVERFVSDLTAHTRAAEIAQSIVESSRQRP